MKIENQKGAVAVEFAIVLPLLVLLLFGIIESSLFLYDKTMITNASREGARAGIVYSYPNRISDEEIATVVKNYCKDNLITFNDDPDATDPLVVEIARTGSNSSGDSLTVKVKYRYDFLVLPDISELFGSADSTSLEINLEAETVMRLE
ncbi:MAG: pilus assembly protein [Deltaproteobacteria bacterium]|jgi:Flp pilus assembly protein TadG|nr:pilus assembly protein [Deltaproteobacteria bacterium]